MKDCEHKNWIPAGFPDNGWLRVSSIYWVYCKECKHFINLLTNEIIDNKGLSWV